MIIRIPIPEDIVDGKQMAIEFESDNISKTSLSRGVTEEGNGRMSLNDTSTLTFHFDKLEDAPKWVELPGSKG